MPEKVLELLRGVDLILHAGDIERMSAVEELEMVAPVKVVCGNMDSFCRDGSLPDKLVAQVEDCRIGLTHGWGAPDGLVERVMQLFERDALNAIVFGHSHVPMNEIRNGILLFNPGTPTDTVFAKFQSIGFLTVEGTQISGEIVKL